MPEGDRSVSMKPSVQYAGSRSHAELRQSAAIEKGTGLRDQPAAYMQHTEGEMQRGAGAAGSQVCVEVGGLPQLRLRRAHASAISVRCA